MTLRTEWSRFRSAPLHFIRSRIPKSLLGLVAAYFGSNMAATAARVVSGLLVARWAGPDLMGPFLGVAVAIPYFRILTCGVQPGINRQLPLLMGQGKRSEAKALAGTAWWWIQKTGILIGSGFAAAGLFFLWRGDFLLGSACLFYTLIAPTTYAVSFMEVTFRTSGDFLKLSRIRIIQAGLAIGTTLMVFLIPWWGLLARSILLVVVQIWLLMLWAPFRLNAAWNRERFLKIVRVGLPLFGVGYLIGIFNVLDRTLILKFLGSDSLGLYTPAIQIGTAILILPSSINQILYPRMCRKYGETNSARSLLKLTFVPQALLAVGLIPFFALLWWLVGPFVKLALPAFEEGIPAARWATVFLYLRCLSTPLSLFNVINRMLPLAFITVTACLVTVGSTWLLLERGIGLEGAPMGCAVGTLWWIGAGSAWSARAILKSPDPPTRREAEP